MHPVLTCVVLSITITHIVQGHYLRSSSALIKLPVHAATARRLSYLAYLTLVAPDKVLSNRFATAAVSEL